MYIVVLLVVYRCSACDMSSDTERNPHRHRSPSDWIAYAVRSDCVRRPIRLRPPSDDFCLGFVRRKYGFYVQKPCLSGRFGVFSR